jgi:hypothetical protein
MLGALFLAFMADRAVIGLFRILNLNVVEVVTPILGLLGLKEEILI